MSNYGDPPAEPYGTDPAGTDPAGTDPEGTAGHPAHGAFRENPYGGQHEVQPGYDLSQGVTFASWGKRFAATMIDASLSSLAQILIIVGVIMAVRTTTATLDESTGQYVISGGPSGLSLAMIGLGSLMGLIFYIWNVCIKQGKTGYTIGKGVTGIKLVKAETGQPIGAGLAFVRQLAHVLDSIPLSIGFLWPLWDAKRQTFADKVIGTYVINQPKP